MVFFHSSNNVFVRFAYNSRRCQRLSYFLLASAPSKRPALSIFNMTKVSWHPAVMFTGLMIWLSLLPAFAFAQSDHSTPMLTLQQAIAMAVERDPYLSSSEFKERAMIAQGEAALALPDPVVSLSIANLPTDGFRFNQEPMTQLKAGVSQMLPRGNSREIQRQQQQALAGEQPFLRLDRTAKSSVTVTDLWLDAYRAQAKIILIEENQILLTQLSEIAKANYASAIGKTRQQDIIAADLEVMKIGDLLLQLYAQKQATIERLNEWLQLDSTALGSAHYLVSLVLPDSLPARKPLPPGAVEALSTRNQQALANILSAHPRVLALDQRIEASTNSIELAKQKYQPQWGVNASYAYRDDDQMGRSRADFLSLGVSFDVPLYTSQKQDNEVSASVYKTESMKTDKRIVIRQLLSQSIAGYTMYTQLQDRLRLYSTQILPQTIEQEQTVLGGFTNDDADLYEVVRAQMARLNAQLSMLDIEVEQHKVHSQLEYFTFTSLTTQGNNYVQ